MTMFRAGMLDSPAPPLRFGEGAGGRGCASPPPLREGVGLSFSPSPLRGGGRGEGFADALSAWALGVVPQCANHLELAFDRAQGAAKFRADLFVGVTLELPLG